MMLTSASSFVAPTRAEKAMPQAFARPIINGGLTARLRIVRLQTALSDAVSESVGANVTGSAASVDGPVLEAKVPWYKKPCAFQELNSVEDLLAAVLPENNGGRMSVVDFYAGWCACCKSSFPALCRIPKNDLLAENFNFYKANIEVGDFASFIKKKGVRGIPYVLIFNSDGSDLIGMGASFKKMEALRKNLDFIATAEKKDFVLDPNGFVINR
ncbi:hypothetical protein Vretimale_11302 [Volvox reticuliferus]|uniref:Thioredoxin domain-containing protein n=1 Tax=Volvox reticuliferus TaxID=1737510 RepID=A0A8J4CQW4_9CHLO|nr:hypothetical protein Vretifemale_12169 [Volvox reticuliferus]GIM07067.1 hypothetical protein Vretimale_11302 [Volvox reticuliferus]